MKKFYVAFGVIVALVVGIVVYVKFIKAQDSRRLGFRSSVSAPALN